MRNIKPGELILRLKPVDRKKLSKIWSIGRYFASCKQGNRYIELQIIFSSAGLLETKKHFIRLCRYISICIKLKVTCQKPSTWQEGLKMKNISNF
jgi:hypothetical protein